MQRIKNEFTVEVYEIHGRIALEAVSPKVPSLSEIRVADHFQNDLGEYNQCQTMLRQLYELGIKGHPQEFLSYRIIYLLHTRNRSGRSILYPGHPACSLQSLTRYGLLTSPTDTEREG